MKRAGLWVAILAAALYAPTWNHFFVSDDFLNLERSSFQTVAEGLDLFSTRDVDFYRPLARLHFGVMAGFFSDRVLFWNLANTLVHVCASLLAWRLARDLLGRAREREAAFAGLLFAVHFIHVEPVVWASGIATLLSATFVLAGLLFLRRARRTGRARDRVLSVAAVGLALMSQETAVVFVPLAILTSLVWPVRTASKSDAESARVLEAAPYAILFAAYLFVATSIDRGGAASPYRFELGPHIAKNVAFFALGSFVPVRYWEIQELWSVQAGFSVFIRELFARWHLGIPLVLGAVAAMRTMRVPDRDIRGGFAWIGAAALPFLLLPGSGERFHYLPSFGACLVVGCAVAAGERRLRAKNRRFAARTLGIGVLAIFVLGALDRERDWRRASAWTRGIVDRWGYFRFFDAAYPVEFHGVPDDDRSAWVFRNGFGSMVRLYWEGRPYWRVEERPAEAASAYRVQVVPAADGAVSVVPVRGEGRGAERPPVVEPPDQRPRR